MEILSRNFVLPNNIKSANTKQTPAVSTPSFKGGKQKMAESLGRELVNSLGLNGGSIRELLTNPKKRQFFISTFGAVIAAAVTGLFAQMEEEEAGITNSDGDVVELSNNKEKKTRGRKRKENVLIDSKNITETLEEKIEKEEKANSLTKENVTKSDIKFKTVSGVKFKEEKEYIEYVEKNFSDNQIIYDRLKELFNKFGGINRNSSHILNNGIWKNRDILACIIRELKNYSDNNEEINALIDFYASSMEVDTSTAKIQAENNVETKNNTKEEVANTTSNTKANAVKSDNTKVDYEVKVPNNVKELLDRHTNIKSAFEEIIKNADSTKAALAKANSIFKLLSVENEYLQPETTKKALKVINKNHADILENLALIASSLDDSEIPDFYTKIANKELCTEAATSWNFSLKSKDISFLLYNELKKANLDNIAIERIGKMITNGRLNNVEVSTDAKNMLIKLPANVSVNRNFSAINDTFEIVTGKPVTLCAKENKVFDKQLLIEELVNDFEKNDSTTYRNIVRYLHGDRHQINSVYDFQKHQLEERYEKLIDVLNNERIFNNNLFSTHSKLRFIERFVLNEHFGYKSLNSATKENMANFVENMKTAFVNGINLNIYDKYGDETLGAQLMIPTIDGDIKITLDKEAKIHTIF